MWRWIKSWFEKEDDDEEDDFLGTFPPPIECPDTQPTSPGLLDNYPLPK